MVDVVAGEDAEYSARFASLHRTAYLSAYPVLGDAAECQDIAQEALARAYARWRNVAPYAEAWVSRVGLNLALDVAKRKRRPPSALEAVPADPWLAERLDLQRALRALPRRQRETVYLRYVRDLAEVDIAAALGISPGTVKTHAARGLAALRELLEDPDA